VAGLAGFCLPTALMIAIHSPVLGVLVQVVRGASTLLVDVLAITAMQRAVPNQQVGRVLGVFFAFVLGATTLGAMVTPGISSALGLDRSLLIMAFAPLALGLGGIPALFSIDRRTAAASVVLNPRVALFQHLEIFADAPRALLERLASQAVEREFTPGEVIINQGDTADYLYVLLQGEVSVMAAADEGGGEARLIRTMAAPAYFGEIGIIAGIPRTATVLADEDCRCALISGAALLDALSIASASGSLMLSALRYQRTEISASMPSISCDCGVPANIEQ
jgi:hypothetical protein